MDEKEKELQWKQYALHVDLYKTYLDIVLKINAFYYLTTGGILSYFFSKVDANSKLSPNVIKYSLLFPILVSFCLIILFSFGAITLRYTREEVFSIRDKLNLDTAPELNILGALLFASSIMMSITFIALCILMRKY